MLKYITIFSLGFFILLAGSSTKAQYPIPNVQIVGATKLEFRICKIRRIFCGQTAVIISALAIFVLGFLMVLNKVDWGMALFTIFGIFIFYNANIVVNAIQSTMKLMIIDNPLCNCKCPLGDNMLLTSIDILADDDSFESKGKEYGKMVDAKQFAECIPNFSGIVGAEVQGFRNVFVNLLKCGKNICP